MLKQLKLKEFDDIQEMFNKAFRRVNTFEDFKSELVEGKQKRAGEELIQKRTKKQKVNDDKETAELKQLEIILNEEEVAIGVIPLVVKSSKIVDWRIYKEGKKSYYQIIKADGKTKMYMVFSKILENFDKEDLEYLYKLNTHVAISRNKPDLDKMSFGDLYNYFKIFEQDVKGTASSSSSSNSQNMAFMLSPSSTNEVNTAYGVSTANSQANLASTQVNTASTQVSTANLNDEVLKNMALMDFSDSEFQQFEFESYGPKTSKNNSKDIPNKLKKYPNAPLVKDRMSYNKDCSVKSPVVVEKKTIVLTIAKVKVVRPKQQKKPVRKIVRKMAPIAVLMKTDLRPLNTARPINIAHLKTTVYSETCPISLTSKNLMEDMLPLREDPNERELLNRALVVKPHNKTPYELFRGRTLALSFMRPFGCHVTILNTLDHLCKFDGKVDKGYFVGYSMNSKASRVYNIRTRRVEENLHIEFLENKPIVVGAGPEWLLDIGMLTKSMIYVPVIASTHSNDFADKESGALYELNSTFEKLSTEYPNDPKMLGLETITTYDDSKEEADFTNLESLIHVSPTPTIRIHKNHPLKQVIGSLNTPVQTRSKLKPTNEQGFISDVYEGKTHEDLNTCLFACFLSQIEPTRVAKDLYDPALSAFLYGRIKEELYVYQPPRFEDPDHTDNVYKVVKALYGLYQDPRAWYETLAKYLLGNGFYRGKIDQTLFVKKQKGDIFLVHVYVDDIIFGSTKKEFCTEFKRRMKDKFQMSSMGEITFFLGLQVKQKEDGMFISQDKYVFEVLRKFNFLDVKSASTLVDMEKTLVKDAYGDNVDVHLYRSKIGSLMYLTASRPYIMYAVCVCAIFQVTPKVLQPHAIKRIFRYLKGHPKLGLWYPRDFLFEFVVYTDSDYAGASLDMKSTTGGYQFLGSRLISWQYKKQTMVATSTTKAEYVVEQSNMVGFGELIQYNLTTGLALYTGDFCCSKGNVEDKILVPKLPKNYARCGHPKQEEKRIEEEQAANARYWKIPACCDDDDDYNSAFTPVLSTEEPDNSLSMGNKHLDTIPATKSNEVIKSSVEDLVPIPSESEGILDTMCDVHLVNNPTPLEAKDHFEIVLNSNDDISSSDDDPLYNENIEYVEASPHNSELISLEVAEIVILKDEEIEDDNLREKLLNFPPTDRSDFANEEFADELAHIISPSEYDCFYFRNLPDPGELISILNFGIRENLSTTSVNLPVEDDHSPLLAYVVWIFLAYLTYPVISPYLHSFGNEDTIFDPGITINRFYSFKPGLSHRCGTFKKFNTHRSHLNESPMEMLFSNCSPMD
nr:uncharacterized mitochondrial protein AtMg00810-like [Tanacetum cinerariifolium]